MFNLIKHCQAHFLSGCSILTSTEGEFLLLHAFARVNCRRKAWCDWSWVFLFLISKVRESYRWWFLVSQDRPLYRRASLDGSPVVLRPEWPGCISKVTFPSFPWKLGRIFPQSSLWDPGEAPKGKTREKCWSLPWGWSPRTSISQSRQAQVSGN